MTTISRFLLGAALVTQAFTLISASAPAAAATTEIVLLQSNVSARRDSLLNNLNLVAASPFSGIVINMPATYSTTLNTERIDPSSVFGYWLQPLVGTMPKLSGSYLNINLRDSGDPFGNWEHVVQLESDGPSCERCGDARALFR
jgi:hypothetical protein